MSNTTISLIENTVLKVSKIVSPKKLAEHRIDAAAEFFKKAEKEEIVNLLCCLEADAINQIMRFSKRGATALESAASIEADLVVQDLSKSFELENVDDVKVGFEKAIIKNTVVSSKKRALEIVYKFVSDNVDVKVNEDSASDDMSQSCYIDLWFAEDYLINYDFIEINQDGLTVEISDASQDLHEEMSCDEYDALQKQAKLQSLELEKQLESAGFVVINNL